MDDKLLEYIKAPGLNSSLLGSFADDPLVANAPGQAKSYFEEGKAWERMVQDKATGSNLFDERFFIGDDTPIPEKLAPCIKSKEPLWSFIELTKKNELHKGKENLHCWISQCLNDLFERGTDKRVRYPVSKSVHEQMTKQVDRFLSMEIDLFGGDPIKLSDMIDDRTLWQYPVMWTSGGLKKKALYDMIVFVDYKGGTDVIPLDIKYMESLSRMTMFFRNTKSRYVIQGTHYAEGLNYVEEFEEFGKYPQMPFLVAQKSDPYYVQPIMIEDESLEYCFSEYSKLCYDCQKWIDNGRPATGIKPTKRVRIWRS
jgi:hypothetical protein